MDMNCREKILSNNVYDYITDFPGEAIYTPDLTACAANIENLYNILYINKSAIPNQDVSFFEYQSTPKLYGLMQTGGFDATSLIASGITQVQRPPLRLTGRGTVICIIDTGIDILNPVFRDENGNSRILAIWDQTMQTGTPPQGFLFGSEYTNEDINRALQSENPYEIVPSKDENGHGTALAGVAAGSSVSGTSPYIGAAPDAGIVVVKLKECKQYLRDFYLVPEGVPAYQENDIMLAVNYVDSFAELFRRPVVICLGLGTNMGDHAGSSALSRYLDLVAVKRSRGVVVCGGNEGNAAHHYRGVLAQGDSGENSQNVEVRVDEGEQGFIMELWGNLPDIITTVVRSPGGESIPVTRLAEGQTITYGFVYERSRITIRSILVEPSSGAQLMLFRLQDPTPGIWTFQVSAVGEVHNGEFHVWLPIKEFLNTNVYFLSPNPYTTLTEPAMAYNVISVSTYNAFNNSFYIESGRGYSRTGAVRPDFAAPGVNITVVTPTRGERNPPAIPPVNATSTGSSLAAAMTAGAVAQFLQWAVVERNNQYVESREIKSYLIRGANRSTDTGYPNREWGYGRLDVAGVFEALRGV